MFETARRRITTALLVAEASVFTVATLVFFFGSLAQGLPYRTLLEFGFEMLLLVGVFFVIWALGFIAATRGRMAALGSIALRLAMMVLVFFTLVGLAGTMLFLLPTTLLLLVSAASKRNPPVKVELGRP